MAARQALDYIPDPGPGLQTHDAFTGIAYDNEVDTPMVHRLARQLRRFGRVQLESSGKTVYFRFFDPAVLNTYLPTCTDAELQRFFGPLTAIYAEHYSEEPSLNKPHLFHRYAITKDEAGGLDLDHQECDLVDQKAHRPARHPAHDLKNADTSIKVPPTPMIPLIRHAQELAFEQAEWVKFRERVAQEIAHVSVDKGKGAPDMTDIRAFVEEQGQKAFVYGMKSAIDVTNFVLCSYYLGKNFEEKSSELMNVINRDKEENSLLSRGMQLILDSAREASL